MKNSRLCVVSMILLTLMLTSAFTVLRVRAPATWPGYVKPSYPDYAPSGMPDFDEKQDGWGPPSNPQIYTWCGPVAVANSLWWLDSEYESNMTANPVPPPAISDHFPLVTAYGAWDDHDPNNVFGLVPNLAVLMDTDGLQSHDGHLGTRWEDLENGTRYYLKQQGLEKYFEVHDQSFPGFSWVSDEVLVCQDVELFLEFKQWTGSGWANLTSIPSFEAGHFVTCAGVNVTNGQVLISDPYQDAYEAGTAPGRSPVPHAMHANTAVHNNASLVSQDAYNMTQYINPPPPPPPIMPIPGYPGVVWELQGYLQTMGFGANYHAFIRVAIATSPKAVPDWPGYIKPAFPDYAPSGMPDFDEKQDAWGPVPGQYTWCCPVAVANSLWWLDSKYESMMFANPVSPPTISDHFNLTASYNATWDDHDPRNVDPFVRNLAILMDTDGLRTHDGHKGTRWTDIQSGIAQYLVQQNVAGMFEVHNQSFPDFVWIDNETEKCQDVELFLEFWQWNGTGWTNTTVTEPSLQFGHCVTCAGANLTANTLLISDPWQDAYEAGTAPGRSPYPHVYPHNSDAHNDTRYVSQDAYLVMPNTLAPPPPTGYPAVVWELQGYLQTMGYDPSFHAFIRGAVATSPLGVHDVAVTNVTTPKTGCTPMPTVGQNRTITVNVTVENHGSFNETSVNVTVYVTPSMPPAVVINSTTVSLDAGKNMTISFAWNTTGLAIGNYTVSATAGPVSGETNTTDNTFTDGTILITIPGDINGDLKVSLADLVLLANAYGSTPGNVKWNPNADLDDNKIIGLSDLVILANHYGQHYP